MNQRIWSIGPKKDEVCYNERPKINADSSLEFRSFFSYLLQKEEKKERKKRLIFFMII